MAPRCSVGYQQRADEACTTGAGGSLQTLDTSQVFPENGYSEVTGSHTINRDDAVALELLISCTGSEPFVVFIDNAYAIAPQPVSPALPVPALNEAALLLLMLSLGFMGWRSFRKTQVIPGGRTEPQVRRRPCECDTRSMATSLFTQSQYEPSRQEPPHDERPDQYGDEEPGA